MVNCPSAPSSAPAHTEKQTQRNKEITACESMSFFALCLHYLLEELELHGLDQVPDIVQVAWNHSGFCDMTGMHSHTRDRD